MKTAIAAVAAFMKIAGNVFPNRPNLPIHSVRSLRVSLLREEFEEYLEAEDKDDLVEIADALADIAYILIGTALSYGIPLDAVFDEVHASNMMKQVDGKLVFRDDGKLLKPPGWLPPQVENLLVEAGWLPPMATQIRRTIDAQIIDDLKKLALE